METTALRPRRPRPKVVSLTDRAATRVREIMDRAEKPCAGRRVGVKNGGCAGQEYVLAYAEAADPLDEVVEDKGVTILIEPKAVLFLIGSEIDYETTRLTYKLVFHHPIETQACVFIRVVKDEFGGQPRGFVVDFRADQEQHRQ